MNELDKKLEQISNKKSFKQDSKKTQMTAPKKKPHLPGKTIQISYMTYRRLKIASAVKNRQLGDIATEAVNKWLKAHHLYKL